MANRVVEIAIRAKDEASQKFGALADKIGVSKGALVALGTVAAAVGIGMVKAFNKMVDAAKQVADQISTTTQEMADFGDSLDKMSLRTNVSADDLAEWGFILERAGGNLGDLETALRRMSKSMNDYQRGLSTAIDAWDTLGVSPLNAAGALKDVNEILLEMADAFPAIANDAERMAIAQEVLGRGGLRMAAAFQQGSGAIRDQLDLFGRLNGEMNEEFTKGSAAVIDAQTDLKWAIRGLKADLLTPLQPIIADVIEEIGLKVGELGQYAEAHQDDLRQLGVELGNIAKAATQLASNLVYLTTEVLPKLQEESDKWNQLLMLLVPGYAQNVAWTNALAAGYERLSGAANDAVQSATAARRAQEAVEKGMIPTPKEKEPERLGPEFTPEMHQQYMQRLDELIADLEAKIKAAKPGLQKDLQDAFYIPLPEDTGQDPQNTVAAALILTDEELARLDRMNETVARTAEEQQQIIETGDAALETLKTSAAEAEQYQLALASAVADVRRNFEMVATQSLTALLTGQAGAITFASVLKSIVVPALSAVIAKLITIKLLSSFVPFLPGPTPVASGGGVKGATGGMLRYANGGPVTGGRIGIDSVPAMLMPGEYVLDRSLTQELRAYLTAQKSASYADPSTLAAGGGGSVNVVMQVARPVGYLDMLDLGDAAAVAARKLKEANL